MSTAVDTAFEELVSRSDEVKVHHGVCAVCYPDLVVPAGGVALCGYCFDTREEAIDCTGLHKCAACLAVSDRPVLPCGHY
jgi:hypothetical protein